MSTQQVPGSPVAIGVGIDTSRYGHYVAFLRPDLRPAADELVIGESAEGYAQLRQTLERLSKRHEPAHFVIRLDAAGQYADNLLHFLHGLATPDTPATPLAVTVSCGDPQRNKNYRAALFGRQKSDPVEARAAARFALQERPVPTPALGVELRQLRQVAGRLQAVVRQRTRLINQLHHLLALTFPELVLLITDLATGWVLELLHRYPTAAALGAASVDDVASVPYLPDTAIPKLLDAARTSIGSLTGATAAELVRDQVRQLRDTQARQKRLESLLIRSYRQLPNANQIDTIPGIGDVTAAVLTAFILDIDRFATPGQLVAYFGVIPIEVSSGVDRDGALRPSRRFVMSQRGNDLVRRYLWMAALSAVRFNPAVRALYARVVAKHPTRKAVAIGHAMRKLLHQVFAIWKSGKAFDPNHGHRSSGHRSNANQSDASATTPTAGHTPAVKPDEEVVAAAGADIVGDVKPRGEGTFVDFAHVKAQLPMGRVLEHLGLSSRLRGTSGQQRCSCPIHRADGRSRTFSVNLDTHVFQCFEAKCGQKGDVIDLWAALHQLSLRHAALDLMHTFNLEPCPPRGTEKRNG